MSQSNFFTAIVTCRYFADVDVDVDVDADASSESFLSSFYSPIRKKKYFYPSSLAFFLGFLTLFIFTFFPSYILSFLSCAPTILFSFCFMDPIFLLSLFLDMSSHFSLPPLFSLFLSHLI